MSMIRTVTFDQLAGSPAESLLVLLTDELMRAGTMPQQSHNWDNKVVAALAGDGRIAAAIAYTEVKYTRSVNVTLGGTHPEFRRLGLYKSLFAEFVRHVTDVHPWAERIVSGHHVDNAVSAAMHKATGRTLIVLGYEYRIERPRA